VLRDAAVFRGLQTSPGPGERRDGVAHRAFDVRSRARSLIGGFFRRALRALPTLERVGQGETIVALPDRLACVRQRLFGRGDFIARVLVGARGLGRVDGALRLLDFPIGTIVAARHGHERGRHERDQPESRAAPQHIESITAQLPATSCRLRVQKRK
jgi:hypothetical protein